MIALNLTANTLGILSLISSIVAFSPCLVSLFGKRHSYQRKLLQTARVGLIITVCLGLIHGLLTTQIDSIDFYNINTYWIYAAGLFAYNLIAFLAFTFAELKSDYKKLNYLSYSALLLLIFHVGQKILPSF